LKTLDVIRPRQASAQFADAAPPPGISDAAEPLPHPIPAVGTISDRWLGEIQRIAQPHVAEIEEGGATNALVASATAGRQADVVDTGAIGDRARHPHFARHRDPAIGRV